MADEKKRDDDYTIELGDSSDRRPNEPRFVQAEPRPLAAPAPSLSFTNNPMISIVCYCGSSILMTVANKYLVSAGNFNLTFFLLFVQVRRTARPVLSHRALLMGYGWMARY